MSGQFSAERALELFTEFTKVHRGKEKRKRERKAH